MLTKKQRDLLVFIHRRVQRDGVSPSFDEMKDALDLKSKSGIHRLITALEERGFIRRLPHRARAIEVVRLPEDVEAPAPRPALRAVESGPAEEEALATLAPGRMGAMQRAAAAGMVPMMGRIAAGSPIEAIQHVSSHIAAPAAMLSAGREHYALEVHGDSMIEAGIHDGDLVVIESRDHADDGDIVVALVHDQVATLKRLRRTRGKVVLEAANAAYEPQTFPEDQVQIQGRLVGLIRTY